MIRVAIVGAGHWGPNLIRNFHDNTRSRVSVVIDRADARLAEVARRFPNVSVSNDASAALASDVDAVVIATPSSTHHALAKAALAAGKHVFVEKPLATEADHAIELVQLAENAGRVLLAGHIFLHNNAVRDVKKRIASGAVGRVYYVSMVRTNLGPIRMDVNAAWDLIAHDISIASFWLDAEPLTVSAVGHAWINAGVEDAVFATLRYPGDVLVHMHASWLNPKKARDITVVGERSMLTCDDMNLLEPIRIYDKQVTDERVAAPFIDSFSSFRAAVREGDVLIPKVSAGEPLRAECEHFLDCVDGRATPSPSGRQGASVVLALEAISRSVRAGGQEMKVQQWPQQLS